MPKTQAQMRSDDTLSSVPTRRSCMQLRPRYPYTEPISRQSGFDDLLLITSPATNATKRTGSPVSDPKCNGNTGKNWAEPYITGASNSE
ncbi:hypothetical protein MY3296_000462 [Beauveria thailandica]